MLRIISYTKIKASQVFLLTISNYNTSIEQNKKEKKQDKILKATHLCGFLGHI